MQDITREKTELLLLDAFSSSNAVLTPVKIIKKVKYSVILCRYRNLLAIKLTCKKEKLSLDNVGLLRHSQQKKENENHSLREAKPNMDAEILQTPVDIDTESQDTDIQPDAPVSLILVAMIMSTTLLEYSLFSF